MNNILDIPVVVLVRHAQSTWNRDGRFTGWANPKLTNEGRIEAAHAGTELARRGYRFDQVYASRLQRARETAELILNTSNNGGQEIIQDWRLNERHYGALQGRFRAEMIARVGEQQVWRWRRSYRELPPPMMNSDTYHPTLQEMYADIPAAKLPSSENLQQTRNRVSEFWNERITPQIQQGKQILISSHGNTLRALLMELEGMSVEQVEQFEIPTGQPIVYAFTRKGEPLGWHYMNNPDSRVAA